MADIKVGFNVSEITEGVRVIKRSFDQIISETSKVNSSLKLVEQNLKDFGKSANNNSNEIKKNADRLVELQKAEAAAAQGLSELNSNLIKSSQFQERYGKAISLIKKEVRDSYGNNQKYVDSLDSINAALQRQKVIQNGVKTYFENNTKALRDSERALESFNKRLESQQKIVVKNYFKENTKSLRDADRALEDFNKKLERQQQISVKNYFKDNTNILKKQNKALEEEAAAIAKSQRELDKYNAAKKKAASTTNIFEIALGNLAAKGLATVARYLSEMPRVLKDYSDAWTKVTNTIRIGTKSDQELLKVREEVFQIAQKTRTPLEAQVTLFNRLTLSQKELGASSKDILNVIEGVGYALGVTSTSALESKGSLMQLAQAFGQPIVRAEELNSILEGTPRIAKALADGLGVTRAGLRNLVLEGKLTNKDFFDAFKTQLAQLKYEFEGVVPTIDSSITVMQNSFKRLIGEFNESTGASEAVSVAFLSIAKTVDFLSPTVASVGGLFVSLWGVLKSFPISALDYFKELNKEEEKVIETTTTLINKFSDLTPLEKLWVALTNVGENLISSSTAILSAIGKTVIASLNELLRLISVVSTSLVALGNISLNIFKPDVVKEDINILKSLWVDYTDKTIANLEKFNTDVNKVSEEANKNKVNIFETEGDKPKAYFDYQKFLQDNNKLLEESFKSDEITTKTAYQNRLKSLKDMLDKSHVISQEGLKILENDLKEQAEKWVENGLTAPEAEIRLQAELKELREKANKEILKSDKELSKDLEKQAKEMQKVEEERIKRLESITDEFKKLSLSVQEYGKYKIDEWFDSESKAIGGVTKELQALYDLKVKNLNFENRYSNIDSATPELGLTEKEEIEVILKGYEERVKAEKRLTDETERQNKTRADEYEKALKKQEDAFIDFSKTVQDYTVDILDNWENMGEAMVKIIKRTVIEMAASLLSQQLIVPIALQAGGALGLSWNGTPMSAMSGAGSNVLSMASGANSVYNAFNGGVSNFLTQGAGGKIGSSIFGNSAWYGSGASMAGTNAAFYGGTEYMVAAGAGATGSAGIASTLATVAPYAAIAAIAIPLLMNAFKKEKDPVVAFHFGQENQSGASSDMGFYTYSQKMSGETNMMVKDYFEKQFKSIDDSLSINFADVIKRRAADADAGTDLVGTGWNPETYGGVEATLKVASTWIAKNLAQGVAEAYGLNGLTNGVGGTASSFFESILPSGSENLLDAFVRFGTVMDATEDSANALARQMSLLNGDITQAFLNLESIVTVFQSIDALVDPLLELNDPLVQIVDQFETWIDSLKEANATLEDIAKAEDKRTQALGLQLTGLSSSNVGSSLLNTITSGGDIQSSLTDIMGKAIADSLSVALTNEVMKDAITPFVEQVGQAFLDSGNDIEAVFDLLPVLMSGLDLTASSEKIQSFTDKWQEMFGSIQSAEEKLKSAVADRDAIGAEYLSALRDEVSILEDRMNDAKSVYLGLLEEEVSAQDSLISSLEAAIESTKEYRNSLYTEASSPLNIESQQALLFARRSVLATQAKSGDVGSIEELLSTSQEYLAVTKDMSSNEIEYAREVAKTNALLVEVEGSAGEQLSEAKRQARYFQDLIDSVNGTTDKITSIDEARTAYEAAKFEFDNTWMNDEISMLEALLESSKSLNDLMARFRSANKTVSDLTKDDGTTKLSVEEEYLAANADVAKAIKEGQFSSGLEHYLKYGQYESRGLAGYAGQSKEGTYLNNYPDVARAVQRGEFASGMEHYLKYGMKEGRQFADGGIVSGSKAGYPMMATFHGTEAIIPMNGGSIPVQIQADGYQEELIQELKELRKEVASLRAESSAIGMATVRHTSDTAKTVERWELGGMPETRVA